MKRISTFIILIIGFNSYSQEIKNVELLDNWHKEEILSNFLDKRYNDCWGYYQDGKEYAFLGSTEGIHIFEVTESNKLVEIGSVFGKHQSAGVVHRDIKTYQNYAYFICDEGSSSLQIVDLSYLPDSAHVVYDDSAKVTRAHNLFIDSIAQRMYVCGASNDDGIPAFSSSLEIYSLSNPENPVLLNSWIEDDIPYVHDCYVRNNIAYLNCGEEGLRVYDFSDVNNPIFEQNLSIYQQQGYNHQGYLTPDGNNFVFADETGGLKIKFCSVENNNITIESYIGSNSENGSIPHNIMADDQFVYVAYYNEGLRIYEYNETFMNEIAYYDTYPEEGPGFMNGAWGIYSDLPSGRLLVSDRVHGLFLLDFRNELFNDSNNGITVFPSLANENSEIIISVDHNDFDKDLCISIANSSGDICFEECSSTFSYLNLNLELSAGKYYGKVSYTSTFGTTEEGIVEFVIIK